MQFQVWLDYHNLSADKCEKPWFTPGVSFDGVRDISTVRYSTDKQNISRGTRRRCHNQSLSGEKFLNSHPEKPQVINPGQCCRKRLIIWKYNIQNFYTNGKMYFWVNMIDWIGFLFYKQCLRNIMKQFNLCPFFYHK